ncbi:MULTISPECIES: hypothetical protein [unclassified Microbacterium]|uniref:hypothetical protein n=1 Tax=unclassified Microbacterium TaxID=2609290 RepID=UPI00386E15E7
MVHRLSAVGEPGNDIGWTVFRGIETDVLPRIDEAVSLSESQHPVAYELLWNGFGSTSRVACVEHFLSTPAPGAQVVVTAHSMARLPDDPRLADLPEWSPAGSHRAARPRDSGTQPTRPSSP